MPGRDFRHLGALLGVLIVMFVANPARANDASLLFSDDPTLIWTEWDLIRNGQAPPTSVYPVTRAEFQKNFTKTVVQEPPVTRNMIGFTLRPVMGSFQLAMDGPISREGDFIHSGRNRSVLVLTARRRGERRLVCGRLVPYSYCFGSAAGCRQNGRFRRRLAADVSF